MNLRDRIKSDIDNALKKSKLIDELLLKIEVDRSSGPNFGDYTSNIALQAYKRLSTNRKGHYDRNQPARAGNTLEFANKLAEKLRGLSYLEKVEVAEPGFLNFFVKDKVWQGQVGEILKQDKKFGSNEAGKGKKARVEFVSANPTGPLHFGNARGGPIGDSLASVLEFSGYKVFREYYHNDEGVQVEKLGQSIVNVSSGAKLADQEYKGEYVRELADEVGKEKSSDQAGKKAVELILKEVLKDCEDMGIKFDQVYKESEFIKSGETQKALDYLKKKKALKVKDGATWFAPHDKWLEDRETVVVKSDGNFTYFANDIAYHRLKFVQKGDLVIDILGSNHHGHVPRLQAVIGALGFDVEKFKVILYQWVRFKRGTDRVKMSKRSGTFVTAREILDEVGKDSLRFFILMHDAKTHIDFDLDLARDKSSKNPVYYVQYAHARIASILAKSKPQNQKFKKVNFDLLTDEFEIKLIKQVSRLPELVKDIAENLAVNQLTTYAIELADNFHKFYENVHVLTDDKDKREARLALILATQIALKNTLNLLGVSVPEKM